MLVPMWKKWLPGADTFLLRSLRGTEWSQLADYVSPSFFEVLRAGQILSQVKELVGNARDRAGFESAAGRSAEALSGRGIPVSIQPDWPGGAEPLAPEDAPARRELGQRVLETYFGQLAGASSALLDLRAARFTGSVDEPVWSPQPFWIEWDPGFLSGIRDVYAGFYGDDEERFQAGLSSLDLTPAGEVFREHFGTGDQRAVRFEARHFHATFHEAFVRCREAGVTLHRNFLALGIYLACLYDHLESLGQAFDVRDAYARSVGP
jgi:hypothetical protein